MHAPFSLQAIQACAGIDVTGLAIEIVAQTASTNTDLLARVGQLEQPTLLLAESQNAGRGRAGRTWLSEGDASLTFSLAWPVRRALQELSGLPLAVGVALAETLQRREVPVLLKWPNDVLLNDAKLAGVLIETALDKERGQQVWVIIGVGMNLALPIDLQQQIARPAAALPPQVAQDRNRLLGELLGALCRALHEFEQQGFAVFMERWNKLHAWTGQAVQIIDHGRIIQQGVALGVGAQGHLLLQTAVGVLPMLVGDVSLRKQDKEFGQNAIAD